MKEGWEIKKLGELYDITSSKRVFKAEWKSSGVPFYRAREIVKLAENGFVKNELFISNEMFDAYSKKYGIPMKGDIMVTGVGTLGICYVVKEGDEFYFKDGNIIWLKKKKKINSTYIEYAFKSDLLRKQIDNSVGATVGTYTIVKAKNTLVPIPPLPEQQRIVAILDEAFEAIDKAKANIESNLQNAQELFQSELNSIFSNKGEDWEEKKLGEAFLIKPSKNEARNLLSDKDNVTFLPMEDLGIGVKHVQPTKERPMGEVIKSYTYFKEQDVLLAKITPCFENGKLGIAKNLINGIGFGSSEYIVFRSKGEVLPEYLYYNLTQESFRKEGERRMMGAVGHKRVSKDFIEEYKIAYPKNIKEQKVIVEKLDILNDNISRIQNVFQNKLDILEELKKSILEKAFKGELIEKEVVI